MVENENKFPDYVTFPRTFEKYKWYKPLITVVIVAVYLIGIICGRVSKIKKGYEVEPMYAFLFKHVLSC